MYRFDAFDAWGWGATSVIHAKRDLLPTSCPVSYSDDQYQQSGDFECVKNVELDESQRKQPFIVHAKQATLKEIPPPSIQTLESPSALERVESVEPDGSAWKQPLLIHAKRHLCQVLARCLFPNALRRVCVCEFIYCPSVEIQKNDHWYTKDAARTCSSVSKEA